MHGIFFYIGLGAGLAAACGLRPFLPLLLSGALASGKALGVAFKVGSFHFLQSTWWLLAVAVVFAASYAAQLLLGLPATPAGGATDGEGGRAARQPLAAAMEGLSYGAGAVLFAGTLADHGDAWWPGVVGGLAAAALAARAVGPIIGRARRRLPDRAAREAVTVYLDAASLLVAILVALLHPLGYVVVALLAWLWLRGRERGRERYAGLRILGR
jgi:hypothetical protein